MHSHDTPVPQWWPCFRHVFFFLRMFRRRRRAVGHCNLWQLHGRCRVSKVDGMVTIRRSKLQRSWHEDLQLSGIVADYWLLSLVPALKKYISFMVLDLETADILVRVRRNLMSLGSFWVTMSWFIFWFGLVVLESYHPSDKSFHPRETLKKTYIYILIYIIYILYSPSEKWSSRTEFLSLAQSAYQELKQMEGHVVSWRWVASPIVWTPGKRGEETLESQRDAHQKVRNTHTHTIMMRMRKTDWMCFSLQ